MNTSGSEGDDPLQEARAYNQSIYLMVAMPYLLLGTVGFMIFRTIKRQNAAAGYAASADLESLSPPATGLTEDTEKANE